MEDKVNLANLEVNSGETKTGFINIFELADSSKIHIPLILINGVENGPKLFLSSSRYGHEIIGLRVIQNLKKMINPKELGGLLALIPIGNPLGFQFGERYSPQDLIAPRFDKPGNLEGSITQRIGATLWKEITSKMNLYVEIHDNYCPRLNFCLRQGAAIWHH